MCRSWGIRGDMPPAFMYQGLQAPQYSLKYGELPNKNAIFSGN